MPRYFFDFRQNGAFAPDTVGCDFPSAEKAYLEAFKAAQEMWADLLAQRQDPRRCSFEIHDGGGNLLFVLPFWEILESCRDYPTRTSTMMETFRQSAMAVTAVKRANGEFKAEVEKTRRALLDSMALITAPL